MTEGTSALCVNLIRPDWKEVLYTTGRGTEEGSATPLPHGDGLLAGKFFNLLGKVWKKDAIFAARSLKII